MVMPESPVARPRSAFDRKPKQKKVESWEPSQNRACPNWYRLLPQILEKVELDDATAWFDRGDIEVLFQVSRATAARILARMGAIRRGAGRGLLLISRQSLIDGIKAMKRSERWRSEAESTDDRLRRIMGLRPEGRIIRLNDPEKIAKPARHVSDLPQTVEIRPGECRIRCSSTQDLMEQLIELVQLLDRNLEEVMAVLG
jgi:hypothetical protein